MKNDNLILATDSYKVSHHKMYSKEIEVIYSYLESRGGKYPKTLFFGLQYYLMEYLDGVRITKENIDYAERFWDSHFGRKDCFDRSKWDYIVEHCGGKLPLKICAIPEGYLTNNGTVLMTIENTDHNCYWLTNFVETLLLKIWYPITIATQSFNIKKDVLNALEKSGDPSGINYKCHDFGFRGVSSEETAGIGSASHLLNFMGTDTVAGIKLLMDYYNAEMCGFSIPATEHSIMCSFGREHELEAMENVLNQYPSGLVACVSDTYDIYSACENLWGTKLKEKILKRDGCLVIRPDSGDFFEVVPKVLQILWNKFGGTTNEKGFKVLDPHIRVIQGDGMNPDTIRELYNHIINLGWSADNIAVGSGGGLLQKVDRDIQKFAIKASAGLLDNEWIDIFKEPITDPGKRSKTGRFQTVVRDGKIYTVDYTFNQPGATNILQTVFLNGKITKFYSLNEIKENIEKSKNLC